MSPTRRSFVKAALAPVIAAPFAWLPTAALISTASPTEPERSGRSPSMAGTLVALYTDRLSPAEAAQLLLDEGIADRAAVSHLACWYVEVLGHLLPPA